MRNENKLSVRICALYCDSDEKFKDKFIEHHRKLAIPISLCKVTTDKEKEIGITFSEIEDVYVYGYELNLHEFDFSTAKNALLQNVQEDIVIYLDIDEHLVTDPYFIGEVLERFNDDEKIGGAMVKIASYTAYNEKNDCTMSVVDTIRIFRSKYRYKNRCHEDVVYSIVEDGGKVIRSRILFQHYGYIDGYKNAKKLLRNLRLICKDIAEGYEDTETEWHRQSFAINMLKETISDLKNTGVYIDSNVE